MTTKIDHLPNEVHLEQVLFGTETTRGTAVVPSARLLGEWSSFTDLEPIGDIRDSEDATGMFDRTSRSTRRQYREPSGTYTEGLTYETLASHLRASVDDVGVGDSDMEATPGYEYEYIPHPTQDNVATMTVQVGGEGYANEANGVRWNEWTITGDGTDTQNTEWQFSGTAFIKDGYPIPGWYEGVATGGTQGVNAVQTLTITGSPDSGTFTVTNPANGLTSGTIAYNAANGDIQTALEAIVGAGNITVSGDALPANAKTLTFGGDLAYQVVPLLAANGAALGGGSDPAAAITEATPGSGEGTIVVSGAGWEVDQFEGAWFFGDFGAHDGPVRQVLDNDSTTLELSGPALPADPTGQAFHVSGMFPVVANPAYHRIEFEGTEVFLDPYDENSSTLGTTDISDRIVSFSVTQTLNLARKRRASGTVARTGRGARLYAIVLRVELDHIDELYAWRRGDHLSLRIQKWGDVIDATATPTPTRHVARFDFECIEISSVTPDVDNNNRTASLRCIALIPDDEDIFVGTVINTLPALP